jgi:ferredoxin
MQTVAVDKNKCLGCGTCVALVPELFKMGTDMKAEVIVEKITSVSDEKIKEAVNACPSQAISAS